MTRDYDPLQDEFDALEREVRMRKIREQQAACPHASVGDIHTVARPVTWICRDCGLYLEARP